MKVKITRTIDISEIPYESRRMLDRAKNELIYKLPDKMTQIVKYSLSSQGEDFFQTINQIDSFRRELASFDESLQEIQNILMGYKQAVSPDLQEEHEEEHEEEYDKQWLSREEAEFEKRQSQQVGLKEGGEENEEG